MIAEFILAAASELKQAMGFREGNTRTLNVVHTTVTTALKVADPSWLLGCPVTSLPVAVAYIF